MTHHTTCMGRFLIVGLAVAMISASSEAQWFYDFEEAPSGNVLATLQLTSLPATHAEIAGITLTPLGEALFGYTSPYLGDFDSEAGTLNDDGAGGLSGGTVLDNDPPASIYHPSGTFCFVLSAVMFANADTINVIPIEIEEPDILVAGNWRFVPDMDGDFDDNGLYECADIDALVADISGPGTPATFDLTGDGNVDLADRDAWLAFGAAANGFGSPYLLGDADLSGTVDFIDLNKWSENRFTATAAFCSGDWNASGFVDFIDLNLWSENRFQSSDAAVPEPSAMTLLLFGLIALKLRS